MQRNANTLRLAPARVAPRVILPGDLVLVYDGLKAQNIWLAVRTVLIGERTKIQVAGMRGYFDEALVIRHERRTRR